MDTRLKLFAMPILLAAVLMAQPGIASAAVACANPGYSLNIINAMWGNATHPISAGPGDSYLPFTITMENSGNSCSIQSLQAQLSLYGGISNYNSSLSPIDYAASESSPSIFNLVYYLDIAKNITSGPNVSSSYPLYISWNYTNNTGITRYKLTFNINIPIKGDPDIAFSSNSPGINSGQVSSIPVVVTNAGTGIVKNLVTTVAAGGVSILSQPDEIYSLGPGQSNVTYMKVYIPTGNSGSSIVFDINSHYISPYGFNTSISDTLGFFALPSASSNIYIYPGNQTLVSGIIKNTSIIVQNTASLPIYNFTAVLSPSSSLSILGRGNFVTIPYIAPDSNASFPVTLYSQSSSSPISTLTMDASYVLGNQANTATRILSFITPGLINITNVTEIVSPAFPTAGQIFSITGTLDNIGTQSAIAAQITASPPAGISIVGSPTTFVGTIPIDTPTAFTISFVSKPSLKEGTYKIPMSISYLNNLNQKQNVTMYSTVQIGAPSLTSAQNSAVYAYGGNATLSGTYPRRGNSFYIIDALAVIAVAGIAVFVYVRYVRKRKRHANSEDEKAKVRAR